MENHINGSKTNGMRHKTETQIHFWFTIYVLIFSPNWSVYCISLSWFTMCVFVYNMRRKFQIRDQSQKNMMFAFVKNRLLYVNSLTLCHNYMLSERKRSFCSLQKKNRPNKRQMIVRRNLYGSIWLSKISCNLKHYNNLLRIQMCGIIHMTLLYQNKSVTRKNYVISLADQNGSCLNTFVLKLIVSGVLFLFGSRCFFATCFIVILIRLECNQFDVAQ